MKKHSFWPKKTDEKSVFWLKILRLVGVAAAALALVGVIVFLILFFVVNKNLPSPGNVVRQTGFSTKIYDRNGQMLYDVYGEQRRDPVAMDQISEYLKQATVAIEDKDFYNHKGFDFLTVFRIPFYYLTQGRVVGGSTLTQQLVKMMLVGDERTVTRKFKELIASMQLESQFSKDQVLNMYLNEAPYGGNLYGVGTAARVYFDKPANELNLVESAILAGLPQNPPGYSPFAGKTNSDGELRWRWRAKGVLRRMYEDGYITEAEYDQALIDLEQVTFDRQVANINAPHFVFYVKELLEEMYGPEMAESGGLQVVTSLDLNLQNDVQTIVTEEVDKLVDMQVSNGASVVLNPKTGEILSMVGSKDYFNSEIGGQFNVVTQGLRQPGSSIKPLTYLAYLEQGNTPATMIADVPTTFQATENDAPYNPKNYDGTFSGPVSVRSSLARSLNVPAVKALAEVGLENFLNLAYEAGIEDFEPTPENLKRWGLAATLGGVELKMLDQAGAYSSFANGGKKVEPVAILKVTDKNGNVIYDHKNAETRQVFGEGEAYLINHILSDNTARTPAFGANSKLNASPNIAVKTGTTNDLKDNWTIGWSENFLVDTWVGNNDNTKMSGLVSGITGAAPMWRRIVDRMMELGYEAPEFTVPDNIEKVEVDAISGYAPHDDFAVKSEVIVKGTLPSGKDPIHVNEKVCKSDFKLATDAQIAAGDYESREFVVLRENDPYSKDGKNRWQEAIDAWVANADARYRPPTEMCGSSSDVFIRLEGADQHQTYNETKLWLKVFSDSGSGIEKTQICVKGSTGEKCEECQSKDCSKEFEMPAGQWEVWAKAFSRDGKEMKAGSNYIGTGGQSWEKKEEQKPEATPTPSPTPEPSPSPTPSP